MTLPSKPEMRAAISAAAGACASRLKGRGFYASGGRVDPRRADGGEPILVVVACGPRMVEALKAAIGAIPTPEGGKRTTVVKDDPTGPKP